MAVDEASRLRLHDAARRTLGNDEADTLMAGLSPSSTEWTELCTKTDLRGGIATLGGELRAEIATLGSELRAEIATLAGELRTEIATLEARMLDRMVSQTRTIVIAMVASNATLVGLVLAALQMAGLGG